MNAEPHPAVTASACIDLNDAGPMLPVRHDLAEVRRRLADTARDWLPALFPQAVCSQDRRRCAAPTSRGAAPVVRDPVSCTSRVALRGWGFDHATGESAGPIDMVYHATGLTEARLFAEAARLAQMEQPAPSLRP